MKHRNLCVVLNYNDYTNTVKYLDLIKDYSSFDCIVVVDNCSTDDSFEKLKPLSSEKIVVVKTNNNGGYSTGNNFGIKYGIENYSLFDYITISNPDIEITDSAVDRLLDILDTNPELSQVSGVICDGDYKIRTDFAWKLRKYSDLLQESMPLLNRVVIATSNHNRRYKKSHLQKGEVVNVDVIPGCFFIFRQKDFESIGYFSTSTFLYIEEDFIAHKMQCNHMKAAVVTDVMIAHYGGTSTKKNIKNYWVKEKIILSSKRKFIKECLHCNSVKYALFNICSYIGIIERIIFKFIRDTVNNAIHGE